MINCNDINSAKEAPPKTRRAERNRATTSC